MAYGPFSANKIQIGAESTSGTAVAADVVWRGPATDIEDTQEVVRPGEEECVGLLVPTDRSYIAKLGAAISIPETEATYEHLPHILEAAIKTATPSGAGPYTYTYAPGVTSGNTIKTYTIEAGNAIAGDVNEMEYSYVESFTLSGKAGEAWKVSSNWKGRQKSTTTFTSLSLAAVEEILFGKTSLYIDATGGTIGSTQKTGVLVDASITVNTGIVPIFSADGSLYFTTHKITPPSLEFSLTMELESGGIVAAERAIWKSQAIRLFRLAAAGTSSRALTIDWAGKYTQVGAYQNANGDTTIQLAGKAFYSASDSALFFSFEVVNNLSALP